MALTPRPEIRIGISGWTYPPWRGVFFPKGLPQRRELEYASRQVNSIEINGSFYGLQQPTSYQKWYEMTPEDFVFSVKCSRYITHIRRLRDIEAPMANFIASGVLKLREKLGPLLWQFPPSFKFDSKLFEDFLKQLPHDVRDAAKIARKHEPWIASRAYAPARVSEAENRRIRHCVEIRNPSFRTPELVALMRKYDAAIVFADSAGKWPYFEDVTSDFVYLRLHGLGQMYVGGYDASTLRWWRSRLEKWASGTQPADANTVVSTRPELRKRSAYVYFDNDVKVEAPFNAMTLSKMMGLSAPDARESSAA